MSRVKNVYFHEFDGFSFEERLFITIVVRSIRNKTYTEEDCTKLVHYFDIKESIVYDIKKILKGT
jgi:hypothetical protein